MIQYWMKSRTQMLILTFNKSLILVFQMSKFVDKIYFFCRLLINSFLLYLYIWKDTWRLVWLNDQGCVCGFVDHPSWDTICIQKDLCRGWGVQSYRCYLFKNCPSTAKNTGFNTILLEDLFYSLMILLELAVFLFCNS